MYLSVNHQQFSYADNHWVVCWLLKQTND